MAQASDASSALPATGWRVHEAPEAESRERLCREAGVHPLVAGILLRRGVATVEDVQRFLRPSLAHLHNPFGLKGMAEAATAIAAAVGNGTRIVVSGDYDVDGTTSTAMLTHFLKAAGARALETFVPNRFSHGYGLTARSVDALLALKPGLVVTVDNGITALAEVERLRAAGVTTVITDHHLPRPEGVPSGIVVNPLQPGCGYPFKKLSGCGVTLKLMMALRERLRDQGWWSASRPEPNLKDYLDLVAIGTIADVVPLVGENRVLARAGLEVLNRIQRRPGVQALLSVAGVEKAVTARTVGFQIAPRINAAGRMTDASLAVELLLARDMPRALELAAQLDRENDNRRAKGEEMFREALTRIEAEHLAASAGIVVASPAFHEGIIGIVAARLVERFQRPVVVLAENGQSFKGSARSVPGLNVTEAMVECAGLLAEFGGHAGAAGCTLPKPNLAEFRARFVAACARQGEHAAPPALWLEGRLGPPELAPRALTDLAEQIAQLEPFGQDHEEPAFLVHSADLPGAPATMGKEQTHLKWTLSPQAEVVGWRLAQKLPLPPAAQLSVRFGFNEYRGLRKVQLTVDDVQS
jgi:single-stranded-DNA-specific exonuclease